MSNRATEQQSNRVYYLDALRILASFAVIVLHVSALNFGDSDNTQWIVADIYDSMTRWCVPVFVMISGALFLNPNRNISYKTIFSKNIFRILTAFIFWSVLYAIYCHIFFQPMTTTGLISEILIGHFHMWFLYMIIGIYLAVPILRQIASNQKVSEYFISLSFVFAICIPHIIKIIEIIPAIKPIGSLLSNLFTTFDFNIGAGFLGYFMLGHYLHTVRLSQNIERIIFIVGIFSFLMIAYLTYLTFEFFPETNSPFYAYLSPLVMFEAIAVFLFVKKYEEHCSKINLHISRISKLSFGIYLIHMLVLYIIKSLGINANIITPIIGIPMMSILIFIISLTISYIISKIPFINKYII